MAIIGMRHVVAAEIDTYTAGAEPTYKTGFDVGMAITGNLTINRNSNPLYADDTIAEDDNSITSMELELGIDDLDNDAQVGLGLVEEKTTGTGTSAVTVYYDTDEPTKNVGVGYMRVRRKRGVDVFQAVWTFSTRFGMSSENTQTKGENVEWQTPTINGRFVGLDVDGTGIYKFRKRQDFTTAAAAAAWLDSQAGITRT